MVYATVRKILIPVFRSKFDSINGIENLPEQGPYIITSNHIDFLDGFYIAIALDLVKNHEVYFLSKTRNYWWSQATLPINKEDKSQSIEKAIEYLKEGKIICNFIEGKRNAKKHLLEGKTGSARMALMAKVPIVPIGIIGPTEKTFIRSVTKMLTKNNQVTLNIGQPINFDKYYSQDFDKKLLNELTDQVMQSLSPLCQKTYSF